MAISIFSFLFSIIAFGVSLADTRLAIEYWFSKEYVLLKLKDGKEPTPQTYNYVSNCRFFGIIETNWYALDIVNDECTETILNDNFLRDGFPAGLNLQKNYNVILITHKGRKKLKERN